MTPRDHDAQPSGTPRATAQQAEETAWLAFRYVSREMTPAELADFEERLAHDQPAREAVTRIVELSAAVRALATEPQSSRRSAAWAPVGWMSLGAAAAVLAMIFVQHLSLSFNPASRGTLADTAIARRLAESWAGHTPADAEDSSADSAEAADEIDAAETASDAAVSSEGDVPSWLPPSWVTAAVSETPDDTNTPTPAVEGSL